MNNFSVLTFAIFKKCLTAVVLSVILVPNVYAALGITQTPLFLAPPAAPIVMLSVPKDHQLYFKAFDDYSDLDNDGILEITYQHSNNYEGYFDSYRCYDYTAGRFTPISLSINKYCTGQWSGNFLNWASMTRIDTLRKLLYGGLRSSDTTTETVLERSYLPNDAHSFAKFYKGSDIAKLTPFAETAITLCNTTVSNSEFSQHVTDPPLLRVVAGNYALWAANHRWQCLWAEEVGTSNDENGQNSEQSGINAAPKNPYQATEGLGQGESRGTYIVRVNACVDDDVQSSESCKRYHDASTGGSSLKPVGLLQTYGDEGKIHFGLMTGSYGKNKSGGMLRKNATELSDEINADGTFKPAPIEGGIISTLNALRLYGYRHQGGTADTRGTYTDLQTQGGDNCDQGKNSFYDGQCSNWGNPQSEVFLETLRYLAGKSATPAFVTASGDTDHIAGLKSVTAIDPLNDTNYCASLNIMHFNTSSSSYDEDDLASVIDIGINNIQLNNFTNTVGDNELNSNHSYLVGESISNDNQVCIAKNIKRLSNALGICPEEPRLRGSYAMTGLAYYAHSNDIRPDDKRSTDKQTVTTYGVTLSPNKPTVVINVPHSKQVVTLIPACRNTTVSGNCAIVDFKVLSQENTADHATGKLYVNWEDSEQGGDFDQDMWGTIRYDVTATDMTVYTDVIGESSKNKMGFGYAISGTAQDGFYTPSGINYYSDSKGLCLSCIGADKESGPQTYTVDTKATVSFLETPLYYAALWGGFNDNNNNGVKDKELTGEWDTLNNTTGQPVRDGIPDRYFSVAQSKQIVGALNHIALNTTKTEGSSTPTTTDSVVINSNTLVYQAKYNTNNWTGQLLAYTIDANGDTSQQWDASVTLATQSKRAIFSYNPVLPKNKGIDFTYSQLNTAQQTLLTEQQLKYLSGDTGNGEIAINNRLLGDIINSAPLFIGAVNSGYRVLPASEGADYSNYIGSNAMLTRPSMLAVGANDGMLHVFDGAANHNGKEIFAYVPSTILGNLAAISTSNYGQHKYFVDGSPAVGDVYFDADDDRDKEWRTVLVGTLGAGGKGIFALDTTFLNPNDYNLAEPEFSAKRVLWEINDQSAPVDANLTDNLASIPKQYGFTQHLGYTLGQASVVRLANGQFAAVFGNGYNSVSETAILYLVDIKDGSLIRSISTQASGNNGLSTPLTVDINKDGIVDAIYAGDLQGNVWKFDVSSSDANNWDVAYTANNMPAPLFTAKIANQPGQPITAKLAYGTHPNGGILLFFGTGSYFQTGDNQIGTSPTTQSFYGIWDECLNNADTATPCTNRPITGRTELVAQTMDNEFGAGKFTVRTTSDYTVAYPIQKGWYIDLVKPPQPGTPVGERVVTQAVLSNRVINFIIKLPVSEGCEVGGAELKMKLNPLTGSRLLQTPFDISGDNKINIDDQVIVNGKSIAVSGYYLDMNTATIAPSFSSVSDKKGNNLKITVEKSASAGRRQSWAQLR